VKSSMMRHELTLVDVLERAERYFGDREIVSRRPDGTVARSTYGAVGERSRRLSAALASLGIERGERVATLGWNHSDHLEAYLGVPSAGRVLHTINPRLHPDDIAYVMHEADDRALLIDQSLLPVIDDLPSAARPRHVIVWPSDPTTVPGEAIDYEELLAANAPVSTYEALVEDDAASMCFTSATTGRPKGVVYSHRSLVLHSIVSATPDAFDISGRDVVMPAVPMFHVNAWGLPFTAAMVGAGLVLPGPQLDAASLLELIATEHVTFTAGVPTVWLRVLDEIHNAPGPTDLSSLHTVLIGGSAAAPAVIEAFDELGVSVLHAWGMTETTPIGTVSRLKPKLLELPRDEQIRYRSMQGIASPLVEVRAQGAEGPTPWDGQAMGELEVRGPWIAGSYLNGVGEDRFTRDGWLRTGDIVAIDPEGYVRIVDRTSDLIKSGGEWISSLDLENALLEHPAVAEAAVVAIPDEVWTERPLAVVVPATEVTADELLGFLRHRFAKWQVPDGVVFVEEIPKTATGKISKRQLRIRIEAPWAAGGEG
jgi:acyl-CoA synthetase (AMP-forming)/AMP-acid ligase II